MWPLINPIALTPMTLLPTPNSTEQTAYNNGYLDAVLSVHFSDFSLTAQKLLKENFCDEPEALLRHVNVVEGNWAGLCKKFNLPEDMDKDDACEYISNQQDYFLLYDSEKDVYVLDLER